MLIVHYNYHGWWQGGIATYIRRLCEMQVQQGHRIRLFAQHPETLPSDFEPPILAPDEESLFEKAKTLGADIIHIHTTIRRLPKQSIPVVRTLHTHAPYCPSGSKYLERWGQPCNRQYSLSGCLWGHIVDHCGSVRPQNLLANFRNRQEDFDTLLVGQVPIVTPSRFLKDQLVRLGYPDSLIFPVYLAAGHVQETFAPPKENVPRFCFLGRLVPQKGIEWLVRAVAQVKVPMHLDIGGDGPQEQELQALVRKLGIAERVTFHGWVNEEMVNRLVQSSRAVIFPSLWHEPGGTVAVEAMAHSRALIITRVGGMPELVQDGVNGLLVDPNDTAQMIRSIERLAGDWELAKQMGEKGRIQSAEYTQERHTDAVMKVYQLAIERQLCTSPS
jgi:glycosyltransferase involved in cell wall biosynthesis